MSPFRRVWPWAAMAALGIGAMAGVWLMSVQILLAVFDPMGTWQVPRISKVSVTQVCRDQDNKLTGEVLVQASGKAEVLMFSLKEASELDADDEVWVLHNYRIHGNRPGHFRLTPLRLLLEYPEPWWILALWGIRLLRKRQLRAAREVPNIERKVWRDDFHERSERFSQGKSPEGE